MEPAMSVIVGIQARSGSTRLKHKSLQEIGGRSIVQHAYDQCVAHGHLVRAVVLVAAHDHDMIAHCAERHLPVIDWGGDENDVLSRYVALSRMNEGYHVVRVTGDCPFVWPCSFNMVDFWSNAHPTLRTVPDGWDFEVMSPRMVRWLDMVSTKEEREHVTAAAYRLKPSDMKIEFARFPFDMFKGFPKMSVDTQEDLDRMRAMYVG
jgi:spore coat polysaccharide biosynthesis protein SpsF